MGHEKAWFSSANLSQYSNYLVPSAFVTSCSFLDKYVIASTFDGMLALFDSAHKEPLRTISMIDSEEIDSNIVCN